MDVCSAIRAVESREVWRFQSANGGIAAEDLEQNGDTTDTAIRLFEGLMLFRECCGRRIHETCK